MTVILGSSAPGRSHLGAQACRRLVVDRQGEVPEIARQHDAVVAPRPFHRYVLVEHVAEHPLRGTVGLEADGTYPATIGAQARRALAIIRAAIEALGGRMEDVVRTRMFVTDIAAFDEVGRAHGEVFRDIRPATSMVEVSKLVDGALVEIEADAIVQRD